MEFMDCLMVESWLVRKYGLMAKNICKTSDTGAFCMRVYRKLSKLGKPEIPPVSQS